MELSAGGSEKLATKNILIASGSEVTPFSGITVCGGGGGGDCHEV